MTGQSMSPTKLTMSDNPGVRVVKDTKLAFLPSVLGDHSQSHAHPFDCAMPSYRRIVDSGNRREGDNGISVESSDDIEALVVQDLNSLSMAERERILHDLHGVSDTTHENPQYLARSLHMLNVELDKIANQSVPSKVKGISDDVTTNIAAYQKAEQMSPSYVANKKFRLMFLRANKFNEEQAAVHMVNFFRAKSDLFGPTKLVKDITLDDLSDNDRMLLQSGLLQASDEKDQAGRPLICDFINYRLPYDGKSTKNCCSQKISMLRVYFYLIMASIQDDVEAQQRGAVKISYCVDETGDDAIGTSVQPGSVSTIQTDSKKKNSSFDLDLMYSLATLQRCLPIRFASLHYFSSDSLVQEMYNTARLVLGKDVRVRSRAFDGTPMEINYDLLTYGIRMHILPFGVASGDGSISSHKSWIEMQRRKEENAVRDRTYHPVNDDSALSAPSFSCAHPINAPNGTGDKPHISAETAKDTETDACTSQPFVHSGAAHEVPSTSDDTEGRCVAQKVKSVEPEDAAKLAKTSSQSDSTTGRPQEPRKPNEASDNLDSVVPQPSDVLFGRGRNVQDHPGNLRLHQLIEENRSRYEDAPKWEKTVIASEIVAIIKEENGRFLKAVSGSGNKKFIVQNSEAARDKVSHTFRSRRTADSNLHAAAAAAASVAALRHQAAGAASHSDFPQIISPSGVITPRGLAGPSLWSCTAVKSSQFNGGSNILQGFMENPTKRPKL